MGAGGAGGAGGSGGSGVGLGGARVGDGGERVVSSNSVPSSDPIEGENDALASNNNKVRFALINVNKIKEN